MGSSPGSTSKALPLPQAQVLFEPVLMRTELILQKSKVAEIVLDFGFPKGSAAVEEVFDVLE